MLAAIGVLLANTIFRTFRPLRLQPATWQRRGDAARSTSRSPSS